MPVGEKKWSSGGKKVVRFDKTPLPAGDYDLKLNAEKVDLKKGKEPGKVPYVNVPFEALGTATTEDGKNKYVFHRLMLFTQPGKDGKAMVERQGGVLELAQSLGQEVDFNLQTVPYQKYDDKGNPEGQMVKVPILNPQEVLAWVKSLDGVVTKATVKIKKQKNWDDSNEIVYFHPAEESGEEEEGSDTIEEESTEEESTEETSEETEETEETEESEDLEVDEDAEEAEEAEEDLTNTFNRKAAAKAATAKAPAKPAAKPAAKGKPAKRK
jgi:hypothetical protein